MMRLSAENDLNQEWSRRESGTMKKLSGETGFFDQGVPLATKEYHWPPRISALAWNLIEQWFFQLISSDISQSGLSNIG